jgi:hypothetical protein
MKISASTRSPSKDGRAIDVSRIVDYYVDSDGTCKMCGHNHSFKFNYEEAKSSIDLIPKLFKENKILDR